MQRDIRPVGVDIFCGAGGMSLGFEQAGFDVKAAIDIDPVHVEAHTQNFPRCVTIQGNLAAMSGLELRENCRLGTQQIDVLFGGPPCQGFSLIGQRRCDDPRSELFLHFARLIEELAPSYFVVENVEGLLMGHTKSYVQKFQRQVEASGYSIVRPIEVLNALDFGVPQRRRRVFILGYRNEVPAPRYPYLRSNKPAPHPTVWDALSDLPDVDLIPELKANDVYEGVLGVPSEYAMLLRGMLRDEQDCSFPRGSQRRSLTGCLSTNHSAKTVERFIATAPGTYEPVTHFYRLKESGIAPTLRAGTDKSRGSYMAPRPIHPVYARCITVREAARLHSFPDWFRFHPTKWHGFRQIGNAVPPKAARAVANEIYEAIALRDGCSERATCDREVPNEFE